MGKWLYFKMLFQYYVLNNTYSIDYPMKPPEVSKCHWWQIAIFVVTCCQFFFALTKVEVYLKHYLDF